MAGISENLPLRQGRECQNWSLGRGLVQRLCCNNRTFGSSIIKCTSRCRFPVKTALKAHGVNLHEALDCINASSGKSGVTETVLPQRILNRSFPLTFALPLLAKDTGIALDLVREAKLSAPVIALTQSLIQASSDLSEKDSDFSSAVKMYESWSKITLE